MRGAALAIFCGIVAPAVAGEHQTAVVMGAGMSSCAEFARDYKRDPDNTMLLYFSWAQGLMSASNAMKKVINQPQHDLNGMSLSDQMNDLRYFCDQRPLATFGDAAIALFNKLPKLPPQSN